MTNPLITKREKQENSETVLLHIKGRLDMNALEDFKNVFADEFDAGNFKIVLNMSQVNFIVSTHLGVIMASSTRSPNPQNKGIFFIHSLPQVEYLWRAIAPLMSYRLKRNALWRLF